METKRKYLVLAVLFVFVFLVNHYPHTGYDFPVHVDEWADLTRAKAIERAGNLVTPDPYISGRETTNGLELGFLVWLVELKLLTGLGWFALFKYLPAVLSIFLFLSVYLFAREDGYGLEAGLLACLIPTTVRLLGMGFLVAVSLCLIFLPILMLLIKRLDGRKLLFILTLFLTFLLHAHPPTAMAAFLVLGIYCILNRKKKLPVLFSFLLSAVLSVHHFTSLLTEPMVSGGSGFLEFGTAVPVAALASFLGYGTILVSIFGIFLLVRKKRYFLPISISVFLLLLVLFRQLGYSPLIMPTRNCMYIMLFLSMAAGFAVSRLRSIKPLYLGILIVLVTLGVQNILSQPYYHVINQEEYRDFLWMRDNVQEGTVLLDPWKANALPSVTGMHVYSRIPPGPDSFYGKRNSGIYSFFQGKCENTNFLAEKDISVIYTPVKCNNSEFEKPKNGFYIPK